MKLHTKQDALNAFTASLLFVAGFGFGLIVLLGVM